MILELCKGVHCVDLDERFQTHIYLQNLASIQPRTSPVKFARSSNAAASVVDQVLVLQERDPPVPRGGAVVVAEGRGVALEANLSSRRIRILSDYKHKQLNNCNIWTSCKQLRRCNTKRNIYLYNIIIEQLFEFCIHYQALQKHPLEKVPTMALKLMPDWLPSCCASGAEGAICAASRPSIQPCSTHPKDDEGFGGSVYQLSPSSFILRRKLPSKKT